MPPDERRQPSEIGFVDRPALALELGQHFRHVDRVPVNDDVEQQAQRTELFLLPLAQGAADFAAFTEEDARASRSRGGDSQQRFSDVSCWHATRAHICF